MAVLSRRLILLLVLASMARADDYRSTATPSGGSTAAPTASPNGTISPNVTTAPNVTITPTATVEPTAIPNVTVVPNVTIAPTLAPTQNKKSPAPTKAPTLVPTKSPTKPPSTQAPTLAPSEPHRISLLKILTKTIAWLILITLGVLAFGACMSNRYRIYFFLRGVWFTILRWKCTLYIMRKLRLSDYTSSASMDGSLNTVIFDNELNEGLLMSDNGEGR